MRVGQIGAVVLGGMIIGATAGAIMKMKMDSPQMRRMYKKGKRAARHFVRQINI